MLKPDQRSFDVISVTGNATQTTAPQTRFDGAIALSVGVIFTCAGGGGTCDVYLQTSLDNGATWFDVANFHFTTSTATKLKNILKESVQSAAVTPTDGGMTSDGCQQGILGDQFRFKVISAGTAYSAGTTVKPYIVPS